MAFAVAAFRFCRTVPRTEESRDVVRQLRRAASAVAANYRATKRSQSDKAFVAKLSTVVEEADESGFWFDFLVRLEIIKWPAVEPLAKEASELVAIFTRSKKTVESRIEKAKVARRKPSRVATECPRCRNPS